MDLLVVGRFGPQKRQRALDGTISHMRPTVAKHDSTLTTATQFNWPMTYVTRPPLVWYRPKRQWRAQSSIRLRKSLRQRTVIAISAEVINYTSCSTCWQQHMGWYCIATPLHSEPTPYVGDFQTLVFPLCTPSDTTCKQLWAQIGTGQGRIKILWWPKHLTV